MQMTVTDNGDLLARILERIKVVRGPNRRGDYIAWCPFHPDGQGKPPHQPNLHVGERGFICHACGEKGGLTTLARKLNLEERRPACDSNNPNGTYDYRDEQGTLLFQVVRRQPKGFFQRRPDGQGGWHNALGDTRRVLYRLPELLKDPGATVWIVEGEKDAERLAGLGLVATTNPGGAGKWRDEYAESLRDRDVVVIPDCDEPGRRHAQQIAADIQRTARRVRLFELPDLPHKGDVSDWLNRGHNRRELEDLAASCADYEPPGHTPESSPPLASVEEGGKTQTDRLVQAGLDAGLRMLRDEKDDVHVRIWVDDHWETRSVTARPVRSWLTRQYERRHRTIPNLTAVNNAIHALEARARFDGERVALQNRIASDEGTIYYDLADAKWRAVRITGGGWEVVNDPPPLFRRYAHQQAQVLPVAGGTAETLFDFINIADPEIRLLFLVYVISCLVPSIPHPVCILYGPQGSSKTTTCRIIRQLIDPSVAAVSAMPERSEQLIQSLAHNWLAVYDNVSGLSRWASDTFCRAATGDGFAKRALYTDDEDFIWTFKRCAVINGINIAAVQPDLMDRSILIGLDRISAGTRRSESELWAAFDLARPKLLGALFTALSTAIREKPNLIACELPRMADFAHWGMAIAAGLGELSSTFLSAYDANIQRQNNEVINAHPLATVVVEFVDREGEWNGTATELLTAIDQVAERQHVNTSDRQWPKQPNQLTRRLNELSATLHDAGIEVRVDRDRHGSRVTLTAKGGKV